MNALTRSSRNTGTFCLAAALAAFAILEVPAADNSGSRGDLWDMSNGTVVTMASSARAGFDARDIFGGEYSEVPGQCVFIDNQAPGFVHFVEWQTAAPVEVGKIVLHASGDGSPFQNQREFDRFVLKAKLPGTSSFGQVLIDYTPAHPYSFLEPASGLVLSNSVTPVTAQEFRAEFTQFDTGTGFDGPRIKELDAFPPDCSSAPDGLVGWWRAEGDARDEVGDNNGSLANGLRFADGIVGQAFDFNAPGQHVLIPASEGLAVRSFTIEAWINPSTVFTHQPIVEFSPMSGHAGVHLWISIDPTGSWVLPGSLFANVVSEDSESHLMGTEIGVIEPGLWSHVALTYDHGTGHARLFHNAREVVSQDLGVFVPRTALPVFIGHRLIGNTGDPLGQTFSGQMDEVSIYGRTLSAAEIAAIHAAGGNGKCPPADCADAARGILAWWRGEGDGADAVGGHDGTLANGLGFAGGIVGQAFAFSALSQHLVVPASPDFVTDSFTLEAWINPDTARLGEQQPIFEFADESGSAGVHFWMSVRAGGGFESPGTLFANVRSTTDENHMLGTAPGLVVGGVWNHVALTYDAMSGEGSLYLNGNPVAAADLGSFTPLTHQTLYLGYRPVGSADGGGGYTFGGKIDEPGYYGRALSAAEIAAIHAAGSNGKCVPPPDCTPAPEGLIAWWPGEGNVVDLIGSHYGSMLGGAGFIAGTVGQGLFFDGVDDAVRIDYSPQLVLSNLTVEAWIKPLSFVDDADYGQEIIFGQAFGYPQLCVRNGAQGIRPNLALAENPSTFLVLESTVEIPVGEFSHLAATWDGGTMKLFVNGSPAGEMVVHRAPMATDCPFFIGGWSDACGFIGHFFHGVIDELSLYNRALSAAEIAAIHSAGSDGKCPSPPALCAPVPKGILAWWRGEDEVYDEMGRHHGQTGEIAYTNSIVGKAMVFDGEGGPVRIPFAESLSSSEFSVETWLKPLGPVIDEQWDQDIVFGQALGSPSLLVQPGTEGVIPAFAFMVHPFLTPAVISDVELPIHEFSHVAGTWDGTTLRIYVNGALAGETMPGYVPSSSTCDFFIGGLSGSCAGYAFDGGYFHGIVDELSFYGRALSQAEVSRIYTAGSNGKCPPPGYVLSVQTSPGGSVLREPDVAEYRPGQVVTLTAVAEAGFTFAYWEGAVTGTDPEVTLLMDEPKQVTAVFLDSAPPSITIESPVPGVTELQSFVLTGQVTDNLGVGPTRWEYNGHPLGTLPLTDGRFLVEDLDLVLGENRIRIYALDVAGNEGMAEVVVEWVPARLLAVVDPEPRQEGSRVQVPIQLTSNGDVGGASFELRYNPDYLKAPALEWMPLVNSALNQVNTEVPGVVRATFALPALPVPAGTETLAVVSFRARSVPSSLDTTLRLSLLDISRPTGDPITGSSATRSGLAAILARLMVGDNNANQRLDVGDATIVQRLLTGLEAVRPWDTPGNDVNQNTQLDSGDVIRVLRAAVGLDPQPTPQSAGSNDTVSLLSRQNLEPMNESFGGTLLLEADQLRAAPGELVTVRVRLEGVPTSLSAVALRLDYPVEALRLLNAQSPRVGALVPATAVAVWTVAPAQNDYTLQSGTVSLAVSGALPWPASEGVLAEFVFQVQEGQSDRHQWPVRVSQAEVSADGYDMTPIPDAAFYYVGRDPLPPQLTPSAGGLTAEGFAFSFLAETGLDYAVEMSTDLVEWSLLATHTGADATITVLDPAAIGEERRFYRVRYVSAD
jgi:hypothetical protein